MYEKELKLLMESKSYSQLTPIQRLSFDEIVKSNNVLLISPTGSGKTEAALWPSIISLKKNQSDGFKIVYVTPLRALNRDMLKRIETYSLTFGLRAAVRHGDSSESERRYQSQNPPDILITTPETLQIILSGKVISKHLRTLRTLIIDEVHELLNDERGYQLLMAISRIKKLAERFQIIALSATIGNPDEVSKALFHPWDYKIINASQDKRYDITVKLNGNVDDEFADKIGADKNYAGVIKGIYDLYLTGKQFIVFTNTRSTAEDVVMRLRLIDPNILVEVHHGSLSKEVRTKVEEDFKAQKLRGIVCTSSMELGIDIGTIDHVIQINSPRQVIRLVQRVGRGKHKLNEVSTGSILAVNEVEVEESLSIIMSVNSNKIENVRIREKPLLVLVNQLLSIVNEKREITLEDSFSIFAGSYIFRELTKEEFENIVKFLNSIKMIYYDQENKIIKKSRKTLEYFYQNISMIPDEKLYSVRDLSNGKLIGFLDESFVATEIEVGSTFILRGESWRVVNIKDTNIYVDNVQGISVPPSWIGEEIPVPFEIARQIETNRRQNLGKEYMDPYTFEKIVNFRKELPGENIILIEKENNQSIIHVALGTKGNYTLAVILSGYLSDKYGESFLIDNTPYSLTIQGNFRYSLNDIRDALLQLDYLITKLEDYSARTKLFQYNFLNVSKKFGIISKDSDMTRIRIDKIISFYKETPIFYEALQRFKWEYLDMDSINFLMNNLKNGRFEIEMRNGFSQISKIFLENLKEKIMPIRPTAPILSAIKRRLMNEEMGFYCLSCGKRFVRKISEMNELRCIFCTSPRIAPMKKYELSEINEINPELRNKLISSFHLQRMYGLNALLVLAGHGIGIETANRILRIPYRNENELLEKILMSEVEFSKNKRFWS